MPDPIYYVPMQLFAKTRSKGFALLITIMLLAFLVLLLVSLATLTRVETQVASNNQQLAQARQNAMMALNIAIGQLQQYAGPDQRTTARLDMDLALANTVTASGRWTGVYGRGVGTADHDDTRPLHRHTVQDLHRHHRQLGCERPAITVTQLAGERQRRHQLQSRDRD